MQNNNTDPYNKANRTSGDKSSNDPARNRMDLTDSLRDQERLQGDYATIDLPDVKDIPGQEFITVPPLGMMADTTISSADEEGEGLFEDDEEDETDIVMGKSGDITKEERKTLQAGDEYMPTRDEAYLQQASMDDTDFEGEALNERSFGEELTGSDLDIPGSIDETNKEGLGQGDEENKHYSLGSDDNDANENRS